MQKEREPRSSWGSIRNRGRNIWQIRYTVGGRSKSETVRGIKSKAEKRLAELRVQYEGKQAPMTLGQFWKEIFTPWMNDELALKTCETYNSHWNNHISMAFGDKYIDEIHSSDIQKWLLTKTYQTAKHSKVVLSSILSRAYALDLIEGNPAQRKFQLPSKDTSKEKDKSVYTLEELEKLAELCKGEIWELAFLFAAFGGGQRSEVCGIKLEEIENIDGYAVAPIKRSVHYSNQEVKIEPHAKNEYRETFIIVAPPKSERIFEVVEQCLAQNHIWLCDDGFGYPMNPMTVSQAYSRWFKTQSIRYIPFMNLRPSYATWMRDIYGDDVVSKSLRHSSTEMLKKIYDRPDARNLIARLNE